MKCDDRFRLGRLNDWRCWLLLAVLIGSASALSAQEWTRFRGPNGSGISEAQNVPVTWTEKDYRWVIDLPGKGISSPVFWKDRLFITSADESKLERYLLCHDASTGKLNWSKPFPFEKEKKHARNSFASATPAVDEQHVYVVWTSRQKAELFAFKHDGQPVWTYDLGPYQSGHGGGTSPVVMGDLVVLNNHQESNSYLVAVNRLTGKQVWKVDRKKGKANYSTPCFRKTASGETEIIFTSFGHGVTAIAADSGRIVWEQSEVFDKDEEDKRAIGSPFIADDLVIGSCGFVGGKKILVGLRPEGSKVTQVFRHDRVVNHMPTAIAYHGLLFMWADNGVVTCARLSDGSQVWQKRVGGNYSGSPICVSGRLYAISDDGDVVVLAAAEEFAEFGKIPLGQVSSSTPAVHDGVLYLRTYSKLFAVGK